MRRRLSVLILSAVSLLLLAVPAVAAEEEAAEEVGSGIVGSMEGLALAAVLAVAVGLVVFFVSQSGTADEPHDDHH